MKENSGKLVKFFGKLILSEQQSRAENRGKQRKKTHFHKAKTGTSECVPFI